MQSQPALMYSRLHSGMWLLNMFLFLDTALIVSRTGTFTTSTIAGTMEDTAVSQDSRRVTQLDNEVCFPLYFS